MYQKTPTFRNIPLLLYVIRSDIGDILGMGFWVFVGMPLCGATRHRMRVLVERGTCWGQIYSMRGL